MNELKLTPEQAVALLNLLQAEEDWEGDLPKALREVKEALKAWLKEEGLRKSPAGSYYLVRR
ncbi:hypothetical protein TthAA37_24110 (plasmid) [Thermus thermophilus]|uniref:Uncharacterized protein n=2 Tax=Thermus thermophilus TaxID=274 RepID=F6DIY4_THETG|nr:MULTISPECIES: hypothetical protein [Thermus]AEG34381.1 hypothetical protein Ththe16_1992 [Thermus thermophilus SG0.5JP17-16]KHG65627.1 hypothetical protein QT17_05590 [Thermus sp. 2.9]BCZ93222.1 hypothetical protein TthAA37_24110 [Thermus thermophilus]VCU54535.1 hypothetical protein TTHNP3_00048 [Thermus thermophilus]